MHDDGVLGCFVSGYHGIISRTGVVTEVWVDGCIVGDYTRPALG